MSPAEKEKALVEWLQAYRAAIVAFSGGVDSTYLAFTAHRVLGERCLAVTGLSPSMSRTQRELVDDVVRRLGLRHRFITTDEVEDPRYAANSPNRCYFCKSELFRRLETVRSEEDADVVLDGGNADDLTDHRPGREAGREYGVRSPLAELGMGKSDIRERSRFWGLPTWDLPATPCLASRFPYGVPVTPEKLSQVETAEEVLRSMGFREFRVRHHEDLARLEISVEEMPRILKLEVLQQVNRELRRLGYRFVTLDLGGFRSGSLNDLLQLELGGR